MIGAIDFHHSPIMSLEQLMALAGHLAQTPRPPAGQMALNLSGAQLSPTLSPEELAALQNIWSTPLRSHMADLCAFDAPAFKH